MNRKMYKSFTKANKVQTLDSKSKKLYEDISNFASSYNKDGSIDYLFGNKNDSNSRSLTKINFDHLNNENSNNNVVNKENIKIKTKNVTNGNISNKSASDEKEIVYNFNKNIKLTKDSANKDKQNNEDNKLTLTNVHIFEKPSTEEKKSKEVEKRNDEFTSAISLKPEIPQVEIQTIIINADVSKNEQEIVDNNIYNEHNNKYILNQEVYENQPNKIERDQHKDNGNNIMNHNYDNSNANKSHDHDDDFNNNSFDENLGNKAIRGKLNKNNNKSYQDLYNKSKSSNIFLNRGSIDVYTDEVDFLNELKKRDNEFKLNSFKQDFSKDNTSNDNILLGNKLRESIPENNCNSQRSINFFVSPNISSKEQTPNINHMSRQDLSLNISESLNYSPEKRQRELKGFQNEEKDLSARTNKIKEINETIKVNIINEINEINEYSIIEKSYFQQKNNSSAFDNDDLNSDYEFVMEEVILSMFNSLQFYYPNKCNIVLDKYVLKPIVTKREVDNLYREEPKEYKQNDDLINISTSKGVNCTHEAKNDKNKLFFRNSIKNIINNQTNALTLFYIKEIKKLQREIADFESIKVSFLRNLLG